MNIKRTCGQPEKPERHCSGCDPRRKGRETTHQGCTIEHGHIGCSEVEDNFIEGKMREFDEKYVIPFRGNANMTLHLNEIEIKSFLRTALTEAVEYGKQLKGEEVVKYVEAIDIGTYTLGAYRRQILAFLKEIKSNK